MSMILYQEVKPKNSKEEVQQYFRDNLPTTREFEGCISVFAYNDSKDENTIRLIAEWESEEHYAKYREFRASLGGQLGKIAEVTILDFNYKDETI